ncbi:MAG: hypothetical protein WAN97_18265 [Candidatus Acidiferrales bacterium]
MRSTDVTYAEISCQCRLTSFWMFSSKIERRSLMGNGSDVCEWKRVRAEIERIRQAVRGIDAHHQRPVAEIRESNARGGRQARLAHAAFAAEQ